MISTFQLYAVEVKRIDARSQQNDARPESNDDDDDDDDDVNRRLSALGF